MVPDSSTFSETLHPGMNISATVGSREVLLGVLLDASRASGAVGEKYLRSRVVLEAHPVGVRGGRDTRYLDAQRCAEAFRLESVRDSPIECTARKDVAEVRKS